MAQPPATQYMRSALRFSLLGLVMLVGAVASFAARAPVAVGAVFLVLMVASGAVGFAYAVVFRNRARAQLGAVKDQVQHQQTADLEADFRRASPPHEL